MFKKLLAGLLAASLVLSLASCNNGGGDTSSTESTGGDSSAAESTGGNGGGDGEYSGTLTIWEGDPSRAVCGDAYKAYFAKKYPNLEIKMETKTENTYQSALSSAFGANQGPDVFWNWGTKNGILESIVAEDYVMPLTDIADMSLFEKDGEKTMISGICYVNDILYGVPTAAVDTRTIYYNKDIFKEHGYKPSEKLSDFEAMCDQMLADGIQPLTVAATEYSSLFHVYDFILCACKDGPEFIKDTEAVKAKQNDPRGVYALEKYMSWRDKGYFSPASTGNDASAAVLEFAQGGTAMIICGSWLLSNVKGANEDLNFDVYKLANEKDGKIYSCITANGSYSIGANTQNLDNAKMFIEWMCTAEAQKTWMDACNSVPGIPEVEAADPIASEIGTADEQISGYYELLAATAVNGTPNKADEENWVPLWNGQITVEEFANRVAEQQDAVK